MCWLKQFATTMTQLYIPTMQRDPQRRQPDYAVLFGERIRKISERPCSARQCIEPERRRSTSDSSDTLAAHVERLFGSDPNPSMAVRALLLHARCEASLPTELGAARSVIAVVRWAVANHYAPPPLCDALAAYDKDVRRDDGNTT
jgi:hypothetical protein